RAHLFHQPLLHPTSGSLFQRARRAPASPSGCAEQLPQVAHLTRPANNQNKTAESSRMARHPHAAIPVAPPPELLAPARAIARNPGAASKALSMDAASPGARQVSAQQSAASS